MKAIEILFDEIDKLNTQIKESTNIYQKTLILHKLTQAAEVIYKIAEHANNATIDEFYI